MEHEPLRSPGLPDVGPWMETLSEERYFYLDSDPAVINIGDIARSLAYQCRYQGHVTRFYSVAEHCIYMATYAPPELKFLALMHDAHEAYCQDVTAPKKAACGQDRSAEIEWLVKDATEHALGLAHRWTPEKRAAVKVIDTAICGDEREVLKLKSGNDWGLPAPLRIAQKIRKFKWQDLDATANLFLYFYEVLR